MEKYDRKKVEEEFDSVSEDSPITSFNPENGDIISQIGKAAVDLLGLESSDVLLDMGTGRGRWAIYASDRCKKAVGLDISGNLLADAKKKAGELGVGNVEFFKGSFEKPDEEADVEGMEPNKLIAVYSMHHLTDDLKKEAVKTMARILKRPAKVVVADIMYFEDPQGHRSEWDDVYYDDGGTDFPAEAEYLKKIFEESSFETKLIKIHPLVGILVGTLK